MTSTDDGWSGARGADTSVEQLDTWHIIAVGHAGATWHLSNTRDAGLLGYLACIASLPGGSAISETKDQGTGTREDPWQLTTPSGSSAYTMYRDESASPPALVCVVGKTELRYQLRCIEDLHAMLKEHGDWMPLGSADEQKAAAPGTVEAWGRAPDNPVGGWYGLKKGLRGRFGMYLPPLLEALGLAEVEHNPKNNRMRAL